MSRDVFVAGVGMVPFTKPGAGDSYPAIAAAATRLALDDAGVDYGRVGEAYAGYVYGDSTAGQRALYEVGMTGIPVFNVNNNCATGSSALYLGRQAVAGGGVDCVLVLGFEQMTPGAIGTLFNDRPSPFDHFDATTGDLVGREDIPLALRYFGGAGLAHMQQYGTRMETFAKIRAKASRHGAANPLALFRKPMTEEEVMAAPIVFPGVMTRLMACAPTCGASAAVLCSGDFARRHGLKADVRIAGQAMTTDRPDTFEKRDMRWLVGAGMAKRAADQVYEQAGVGPSDIDVAELHDCFAQNELISYEALGFCPEGGAEKFVCDGDNTYGGRVVTNPSGGLLSKGHPLGATGLAQCTELVQQLRGEAEARQVEGARLALQHNLGLGGACVVTLYERV
ncbi:MAG: lipid-transfer protein [Telmatospirillum sp.]|nr:lipid-transfer protein [Telmatospirillum sp.]